MDVLLGRRLLTGVVGGCGCMRTNAFLLRVRAFARNATFNRGLPSMPVHAFLGKYFICCYDLLPFFVWIVPLSVWFVLGKISPPQAKNSRISALHGPCTCHYPRTRNLRLLSPLSLSLSCPPSFVLSDYFRYSTFHASRPFKVGST